MRIFVLDELADAAPAVALPRELERAADLGAAHLVILHANVTGAVARVAELRRSLRGDTLLFALTDEPALDHLGALLGAGADDHLVWPRDAVLLPSRLAVLSSRRSAAVPEEIPEETSRRRVAAMQEEWRQRYHAAREGSGHLFYDYDPAADTMTGGERPQTLDAWARRVHPDDRRVYRGELGRAIETGAPFVLDYRVADGERWTMVEDRGHVVARSGGAHLVGFVVDVGERDRAVRALAESEGRLRAIIELASDAIFVKDTAGRYTLMNPVAARFFGKTVAECLGQTDADLLGAEGAKPIAQGDREVTRTRTPLVAERRKVVAGEERMFLVSTAPFVAESGELLGVIGISHDVSERKKMEAQLQLADRMVSVGTLAAGVAHEINNPLAYVSGNLDYVRGRLSEVLARHPSLGELVDLAELVVALDDSIEGAERMRSIVRDLRAFSRADDNERGAVDVVRVIDVAVRMTQPALRHRAQVVVKASVPMPPVLGDAARLGQVLVNLLVNSVQAMPVDRDARQNEIRVGTRQDGERVVIELSDNGVGMTEEVQRHIFDPFYTTKLVGEGTGLGLWICRNTVAGMGGEIDVASAPGHGTVFQVKLPLAPSASQRVATVTAPSSRRPRLRLLVLDDEPKMVAGLRRMLGDDNDIVPFTDAREALAHINSGERFDAVLCDLMMPGMDGMAFYGELSRVAPAIASHTGFVTGGALTDPARAFVDEHATRWLQKPFEVEGLRAFVATLLAR